MNLRDAQRFLSDRKNFLTVERIDGHDWVTDRFVGVRRDQLPASFKVETTDEQAYMHGQLRTKIRELRGQVIDGRANVVRHATTTSGLDVAIVTRGSLMVAVNGRVFSGMPGEKRITTSGAVLGYLPDKKGTPRLVAVAMPIAPRALWPIVKEAKP